jgi:hypothetical protein
MMSTDYTAQVIQANFRPRKRSSKKEARLIRLLGIVLGVLVLISLAVYSINLQMETRLNGIRRETVDINEKNKELEIHLDQLKALSSVEKMARSQTRLTNATEQIELKISPPTMALPLQLPMAQKEQQLVYGY